jgi:hypothetical protein
MGDEAQAQIDSLRERHAAAEAVAAEVARIKAINADLEAALSSGGKTHPAMLQPEATGADMDGRV